MSEKKRILIVTGPTGSGETTLTNAIIEKFPIFCRLITATTRPIRNQEKNGSDYYFFSKEEFLKEIESDNILEHTYIENRDTYYGTYKPDLEDKLKKGFDVIVNVDIVGVKYFKDNYGAVSIFIMPDSMENIKKRLLGRQPDMSQEELEKRLINAKAEMEKNMEYYDYIVTNKQDKLDECLEEIFGILKKEDYKLL